MVRFQLLGPVEVRLDGEVVQLRGPKQRALLAMLLLSANSVVSRHRLIEGLWGADSPAGVEHALDAQVSSLRQALAFPGCPSVERSAPGYLLAADPDSLDVSRFDRQVAVGRRLLAAGHASEAARAIREALDLWRGPALADIQSAPFAAEAADELERRHLDALEERVDADLACGLGAELVTELESLVHEHPFRERLLAALALSLHRAGQQARALEVIAAARRQFAADLGLQPGAAVLDLERRILQQDPSLLPGSTIRIVTARLETRPVRRGWRSRRWLTAGVAALAIGGLLTLVETNGHAQDPEARDVQGGDPAPSLATSALASVDITAGTTRDLATLPATPSAAVAGPTGVWVSQASDNRVSLINPADGEIRAQLSVSSAPGAMAIGDDAVWVAMTVSGSVVRIDQQTRQVTQSIPVGGVPAALAFAADRLWVADQNGRRLLKVNPGTGKVEDSLSLPDRPTALVAHGSGVWVASHDSHTVTLVDVAAMSVVASVQVGGGPTALAVGDGSIWVANNEDATVSRLDLRTARVRATVPVNSGPAALAFAAGQLWVAGEHANTLGRVDSSRNAMTQQIRTRGSPVALTTLGGRVWVGTRPNADVSGGILTLLAEAAPATVDPGFQFRFGAPQFLGLVHDGLVTFEHTSGPRGLQLVPDLAVALPTPTASATSFAFRLRPGIRYSTGVPVRADDFRRAFERLFRGYSVGRDYFSGIVGASSCEQHPTGCVLSRGVVTNNALGTVTFHLSSPDPDFLFRLAAINYASPVPPGTPMQDTGMTPVPGTGPYRIDRADAQEIRFVRNPLFREWSYAAQPAGNPDVIVWRFGLDRAEQVDAVRRGDADWMFEGIPPAMWTEVSNHDVSQLHLNDIPETDFLLLRTTQAPFDNLLARRALNLAIDRGQIADAYGGPGQATPTCQILPPGETARVRYCPYTGDPERDGTWSAPDLERARQLTTKSGTRGATVRVLGISDTGFPPAAASRVAARALTQLGYRVQLRILTQAAFSRLPARAQGSFDVFPFGWYADFPSPASFFQTLLPCFVRRHVCEQALHPQIERTLLDEAQGRGDPDTRWSAIDRRATQLALTVPLVNPRSVELTSRRLHGYESSPQWGFLPALASLR